MFGEVTRISLTVEDDAEDLAAALALASGVEATYSGMWHRIVIDTVIWEISVGDHRAPASITIEVADPNVVAERMLTAGLPVRHVPGRGTLATVADVVLRIRKQQPEAERWGDGTTVVHATTGPITQIQTAHPTNVVQFLTAWYGRGPDTEHHGISRWIRGRRLVRVSPTATEEEGWIPLGTSDYGAAEARCAAAGFPVTSADVGPDLAGHITIGQLRFLLVQTRSGGDA